VTPTGVTLGGSPAWATQHLVFKAWWCPKRFRPAILRAFGASVGRDVLVRNGVRVQWPWKLSIGDCVWIGEDAWLLNLEPITVGSNVCISQQAFICTGSHDRRSATFEFDNGPVTIEDGAWIAMRGTVLRGVTIGSGALVGACALAVEDLPAGGMVVAPTARRGSRTSSTTFITPGVPSLLADGVGNEV
jgi:putative colanic acid biosynthesis acetyltransferase WcaF